MIVQCICQQLRTILYGDIKWWQLCEIQFAWSLNPIWHNRQGMHVLKPTEIKELSRIFWRENCSGPRLRPVAGQRAALWMHVVRSRVTKIFGDNEFTDSIRLFLRHLTTKKNSRNRKMQYYNHRIALKFNWHLGSIATDGFAKFHSDW